MTTVLVAGTFDGLHKGHEDLFKQAKQHGDYLIVIVARDQTVLRIKKRAPVRNEIIRLNDVASHKEVDKARLGNAQGDLLDVVLEEKPNVVCLGYDQRVEQAYVKDTLHARGLDVDVFRLKPYEPHIYKSSLMKR